MEHQLTILFTFLVASLLLLVVLLRIMVVSSAVRFVSKETTIAVEVIAVEAELLIVKKKRKTKPASVAPVHQHIIQQQLQARVYDTFGGLELALSSDTQSKKELMEEEALYYPKRVQFSEPLVTRSWEVPRIAQDAKKAMFYSRRDISQFRRENRTKFGKTDKYDRVFCEQLVENLDQLGAANYAKGDFIKAMDAFNHALRVRSQTHVDFDPKTTCKNIHCIADIYSNQRNWKHALEAYRAALYAIRSSKDDDVFETIACLEQKVALVEKQVDMSEKRRMMDVL